MVCANDIRFADVERADRLDFMPCNAFPDRLEIALTCILIHVQLTTEQFFLLFDRNGFETFAYCGFLFFEFRRNQSEAGFDQSVIFQDE